VVVSAEVADKRHDLLESFEPRHKNATHEGVVGKEGKKEREMCILFFLALYGLISNYCCRFCLVLVFPPLALYIRSYKCALMAQHWDSVQTQRIQEGRGERKQRRATFTLTRFLSVAFQVLCMTTRTIDARRGIKTNTNSSQAP